MLSVILIFVFINNHLMQTSRNFIFRMYLLCFRFDGKATIQKTVPDTITSWVISGFSVDPLFGLGLSEAPRKV
jgi:hypothetical protein